MTNGDVVKYTLGCFLVGAVVGLLTSGDGDPCARHQECTVQTPIYVGKVMTMHCTAWRDGAVIDPKRCAEHTNDRMRTP